LHVLARLPDAPFSPRVIYWLLATMLRIEVGGVIVVEIVVEVSNLSVSYNGNRVIHNVSFPAASRQLIGVIGPNGAGKTTLIKAMVGLLNIDEGAVVMFNQPVKRVRRKIAYVPQRSTIDFHFPVRVEDVVLMGRYPHLPWWRFPRARDYRVVEQALQEVELLDLRQRQIGQLSGGQQQRVFLARALAQQADLLFLDEPFAGIDIQSEEMIMQLLKNLRDRGKTIFVVNHDLNKAGSYFDNLLLLRNSLIAWGKAEEVLQPGILKQAYCEKAAFLETFNELVVVSA